MVGDAFVLKTAGFTGFENEKICIVLSLIRRRL